MSVMLAGSGKRRLVRLAAWSVAVAAAVAAVELLPYGAVLALERWVPHRVTRAATIHVLQLVRLAYLLAVAMVPVLIAVSVSRVARARRRRTPCPGSWCALALGVSIALGAVLLELGATAWDAWAHRLPELRTTFPPRPANEVNIVVVGESSAQGVPYERWLSVGAIVAWQLEKLEPERTFRLHMLAHPGHTLEQAILQLMSLKVRPDLLIVYSGQNEFQSRFGWSRSVRHYADDGPADPSSAFLEQASRVSPLCAWIAETIEMHQLDAGPPPQATRGLVDRPVCTPVERARLRIDFERRLEQVLAYCDQIGTLPLLIIPPSNDAGFPPNRSYLRPDTAQAARAAFARRFRAVRALEATDPAAAERGYRSLLDQQPAFAEAHYRLARLCEREGAWDEARAHYGQARDLDGLPLRSPTDFQDIDRTVAARHHTLLVDGPAVLRRISPHGILDDHLLHDEQHPTFRGYVALAEEALTKLHERRAFGWPASAAAPVIDPRECAARFGLDRAAWAQVCEGCAATNRWFAFVRNEPAEILAKADRYARAAQAIAAGQAPETVGVPGLGEHPAGLFEKAVPDPGISQPRRRTPGSPLRGR